MRGRRAFTLVELCVVVMLIAILAGIALGLLRTTRSDALGVKMQIAEREFSKGVESLLAQGLDPKSTLLGDTTAYSDFGQTVNDPVFMGMTTRVYRVSAPIQVSASKVNALLDRLNTQLQSNNTGFSHLRGGFTDGQLARFNADLVDVQGGTLFLKFYLVNP